MMRMLLTLKRDCWPMSAQYLAEFRGGKGGLFPTGIKDTLEGNLPLSIYPETTAAIGMVCVRTEQLAWIVRLSERDELSESISGSIKGALSLSIPVMGGVKAVFSYPEDFSLHIRS